MPSSRNASPTSATAPGYPEVTQATPLSRQSRDAVSPLLFTPPPRWHGAATVPGDSLSRLAIAVALTVTAPNAPASAAAQPTLAAESPPARAALLQPPPPETPPEPSSQAALLGEEPLVLEPSIPPPGAPAAPEAPPHPPAAAADPAAAAFADPSGPTSGPVLGAASDRTGSPGSPAAATPGPLIPLPGIPLAATTPAPSAPPATLPSATTPAAISTSAIAPPGMPSSATPSGFPPSGMTPPAPSSGSVSPAPPSLATNSLALRRLILDRRQRVLQVLDGERELRRFPVGVGMPGWETPAGSFAVLEKRVDPIWQHPANGQLVPPGPGNPLGSRWIGFHRDCNGRRGFNGQEHLEVKGCVTAGFHGTPNRESVGRAASHGCVRLFDEHARELFELVQVGTPVIVLP